jgi:ribosomal protein S18 acetylase RimI-like enzyme
LETQGLITVNPSPDDRRVRDIRLTDSGREEVAVYDRLSDDLAASILQPLDNGQRSRLTAAMAEVERLLRASSITVTAEPSDGPDVRRCVTLYIEELNRIFDAGFDPNLSPTDHADFLAPHGVFLIARLDGEAVGCGGLKSLDAQTGEIKRLWIAPDARGLGLGRRLVRMLEDHARNVGLSRVVLDTNHTLTAAQALYISEGYAEVPPYNDNPYADHWFAKRLS